MRSARLNLPAAYIITDVAGLKCPPEMFPPTITAIAKAAPIAIAFPVAIITYKKNRVPKNSTTNLLIIGLEWIGLNWIGLS